MGMPAQGGMGMPIAGSMGGMPMPHGPGIGGTGGMPIGMPMGMPMLPIMAAMGGGSAGGAALGQICSGLVGSPHTMPGMLGSGGSWPAEWPMAGSIALLLPSQPLAATPPEEEPGLEWRRACRRRGRSPLLALVATSWPGARLLLVVLLTAGSSQSISAASAGFAPGTHNRPTAVGARKQIRAAQQAAMQVRARLPCPCPPTSSSQTSRVHPSG